MKVHLILKAIEGTPTEFQVLPSGTVRIEGDKDAFVDDMAMDSIIAEFDRRGNDLVIDYEHQTLTGKEAPAAGWVRAFLKKGTEGLWATVEWTDKAREYIAKREYRYFSPVFWVRLADQRVVVIDSIALTNFPKINHLQPITAKMNSEYKLKNDPNTGQKEEKMTIGKLKKICKLADNADEAKVVEAVEAVVAKNTELELAASKQVEVIACKEVMDELKLGADAKKEVVLKSITDLRAAQKPAQELSLEVTSLRTELSEIKQNSLISMALTEGKTSPDELDKWARDLALKSPDQFKLIVLSRPPGSVIPVGDIAPGPQDKPGAITDGALLIAKQFGNTAEDLASFGA